MSLPLDYCRSVEEMKHFTTAWTTRLLIKTTCANVNNELHSFAPSHAAAANASAVRVRSSEIRRLSWWYTCNTLNLRFFASSLTLSLSEPVLDEYGQREISTTCLR